MNKIHLSSKIIEYSTPQDFFDALNKEFKFNLDPCATKENAKCKKFFTEQDDGLAQDWGGHRVFCNPPYGRKLRKWVAKASMEASKPNTKVVMLIPARTDTFYFHDYIYGIAEIRFVRGRLRFGKEKFNAPFPCMVVIF